MTNYNRPLIALSITLLSFANQSSSLSICAPDFPTAKDNCATYTQCESIGIDEVNCNDGEYCFGPIECPELVETEEEETVEGGEDSEGGEESGESTTESTVANVTESTVAADNNTAQMEVFALDDESLTEVNDTQLLTAMLEEDGDAEVVDNGGEDFDEPQLAEMEAMSAESISPVNETEVVAESTTEVPATTTDSPTSSSPTSSSPTYATTTASPTTIAERLINERSNMTNPSNHYCGTSYTNAKDECNTNVMAIPCPGGMETPCPSGLMCFAIATECTPATASPSSTPSLSPTTIEPTTSQPSSSPISADDTTNMWYCGETLEHASQCLGKWCRSTYSSDCPENQSCYQTTTCNATLFNYTNAPTTIAPTTPVPSVEPTTSAPTEDLNPGNYYCGNEWRSADYDGDCGVPCPSGDASECPNNMACYPGLTSCTQTYKVGVSTNWCAPTKEDMPSQCSQECPNGTDEECPSGETCWADSPCAYTDAKIKADEELKSKLWCAKSYKHLVEHCPMPCEGGTDDECGPDMTCFNMSEEEVVCTEPGVGIKDPVDPDNLWCGNSWNDVLENCGKKCPEGTDEECGYFGTCYDLTGNEPMICQTEGFGVKTKGDPNKRYCGNSYNHMMEFCPQRCPNGDECPDGSTCFEESPCTTTGVSAPGFVKMDSTKMFCGETYLDATSCGIPCPTGGGCAVGSCWAEVECNAWASTPVTQEAPEEEDDINMMLEVTVNIDEAEDSEQPVAESMSAPQEQDELSDVSVNADDAQVNEPQEELSNVSVDSDSAEVNEPQEPQAMSEPVPVESNPPPPVESSPPPPPPPVESNPPPVEAESNPPPPAAESNPPPAAESANPPPAAESSNPPPAAESNPPPAPVPAQAPGVAVDNLRMALYGLNSFSAAQLVAWEDATASYFQQETGVTNEYDVTSMNLASGRRQLRTRKLGESAYLLTYTQTLLSPSGNIEDLVQDPFDSPSDRYNYVQYLWDYDDELFGDLASVSAVMIPIPFNTRSVGMDVSSPMTANSSAGGSPPTPPVSSSTNSQPTPPSPTPPAPVPAPNPVYKDFFCHNSGEGCPSGECPGDDLCYYVPNGSEMDIKPFSAGNDAENILGAALAGDYEAPSDSLTSSSYGPTELLGLKMTLYGVCLRDTKQISEWEYLTAMFEQTFYNEATSSDATQTHVFNIATVLEVTEVSYGDCSSSPSTTFNFKQDMTYDSTSPDIGALDIAIHPFSNSGYREDYVEFLKASLLETFADLTSVPDSGVAQSSSSSSSPSILVSDSAFCATSWPFDCSSAQPCNDANDCSSGQGCFIADCTATVDVQQPMIVVQSSPAEPVVVASSPGVSPYYAACNLCKPNQVGINNPIMFNQELSDCATAYSFMAIEYQEGDPECIAGQAALGNTCCRDADDNSVMIAATQSQPVAQSAPVSQSTTATDSDDSPTTVTVTVNLSEQQEEDSTNDMVAQSSPAAGADEEQLELEYPSNTYFCGSSLEDAAMSCSIPCSSGQDSECIGDLQCFGNTECANKESFFCGTSWFDASDKCGTPCPSGDALECENGEACFAWTSCAKSESFYCGESFEDASSNCVHACPGRSSNECPDGLGCFAYTTCEATNEDGTHEVDPGDVPMKDYFCGTTKEEASSECSIACQSGEDSECPNGQQCFEGTGCGLRESFSCGATWMDAAEMCTQSCSSGSSEDCPGNQLCFAHTGCQENLFFCGDTFEGADCNTPCPSRSSGECPGSQSCFAFVSQCATGENSQAEYSYGIANTQWNLDGATSDGVKQEEDWYTKWQNDLKSSSSKMTRPTSLVLVGIVASFSLVLSLAL